MPRQRHTFVRHSLLITTLLSTLLSGCSGSSSSTNTTDNQTPDSPTDTQPPSVSSTLPASDATGVARNTVVSATFDEDLFATTVDGASFTLAGVGSVSASVSYDANTRIASLTPDTLLYPLTTYTATLDTAITDLSGNALPADYSWSFTTADGNWGSDVLIETNDTGDAVAISLTFRPDGTGTAVWTQYNGSAFNVWTNTYTPGSGWGTASVLGSTTNNAYASTEFAVDSDQNGNTIAVWLQTDGTTYSVMSSVYTTSAGWSNPVPVESGSGDAYTAIVKYAGNGDAIALFAQFDSGGIYRLWSNRYSPNTGWGSAQVVSAGSTDIIDHFDLAIDSNGNMFAVWRQKDSGTGYDLWVARYTPAGGWGAPGLLESATGPIQPRQPRVVADANGNATATWSQWNGSAYSLYANHYTPGANWSGAILLETDDAGNVSGGGGHGMDIDVDGNVIVVWDQYDGNQYHVYAALYSPGNAWSAPVLLEGSGTTSAFGPRLAFDTTGKALAVWYQPETSSGPRRMFASRYVPGNDFATSWSTPVLIDSGTATTSNSPIIAIDATGSGMALWESTEGSVDSIRANRFE